MASQPALSLVDAGGYSHAYQTISVTTNQVYTLAGGYYRSSRHCDTTCCGIHWCTPAIIVFSGGYSSTFYMRSDYYLSLNPTVDGWSSFSGSFTATDNLLTVYIVQNGDRTAYYQSISLS